MKAYILIKVPALRSGGIAKAVRGLDGVKQAWALYGDEDIIAEVEVADNHALDRLVMREIQGLSPQVSATRTYIVIEDGDVYDN